MKIIICGAGQVGWQIARHLSGERNDVTVVDSNPDLVRRAMDTLDVQGVSGFASYPDVLEKAGAKDAEMIIAATHSDEVNMVTCQVAHSVFDIPRKIARLRSKSYLDAIYSDLYRRDHMPIDVVISPEREVADAALKRLSALAAFDTELFLDEQAQLLGLRLEENCPVLNTPLRQLNDLFSTLRVIVIGVRRQTALFAPEAGDQLFAGDEIYVMCHAEDTVRTMEVFGKSQGKQDRVVLVGGGNVGLSIAKSLESRTQRVRSKIIEKDRNIAEHAANELEKTIVSYTTALSTLDNGRLEPLVQPALKFYNQIAYDDAYNGLALDNTEGARLASALADKRIAILANHGVITTGPSVAHAFNDLYYLERAAQAQILAYSKLSFTERV